jgi:hypothetical protein
MIDGRRGARAAPARRHDRRGDLRQHGRRARRDRRLARLPMHRRDAGGYGAVKAKLMTAAGAGSSDAGGPDDVGRVLEGRRDRRLHPGPTSPASSTIPSIPRPTSRRRAPRSPSRSAAASTRGSRRRHDGHVHRRRPLPSTRNPRDPARRRRAAGLDPRRRPAGTTTSRDRPLADLADPRPERHRRGRHRHRRGRVSRRAARSRARRGSSPAAPPAPPRSRALRIAETARPGQDGRHAVPRRRGSGTRTQGIFPK